MVRHIVMFRLADEACGKTKQENALKMKADLEALQGKIAEIVKINVWINSPGAPAGNYDVVLDSEFESFAHLEIYAMHPEHLKVAEFIGKVRTNRAAVDYEF